MTRPESPSSSPPSTRRRRSAAWWREIPALVSRVVVVDNGSRDRTAEVARAAGAWVVHEPRRGYGQACLAGIAAAPEADVVAFLDGDYSDYPGQLVDVLAPILRGEADLVIGSRNLGRREEGAHPLHAVLGTRALRGPHEPALRHPRHRPRTVPRHHRARPSRASTCATGTSAGRSRCR